MKNTLFYLLLLSPFLGMSQNILVDSQSFTAQELVQDILIDSGCIENVLVTNVVGGDFGGNDQSYGYFDATGTTFPFQDGIVLTTGRLQNTQGPNTTLSDDDAPNWLGDLDLEQALNEPNTTNATILEFNFETPASEISFRYIFASEEYQEGDPNTCQFSDLFGFLIREDGEQGYTNIALVPNTQTPVKVTTVHPEIPGGCPEENEFYFESFNGPNVPINFNGQTKVLTATAAVVPNKTYNVKLVIADEQNFRFDSAVFLEGGSFQLSKDLGEDRLLSTSNALCENETVVIDATETGMNEYTWFKDSVILAGETDSMLTVDDEGVYSVIITLENGCDSFGEIIIEFDQNPIVSDSFLQQCDTNQDGLTTFNLFAATEALINGDNGLIITDFYTTENQAIAGTNPIPNPTTYQNTSVGQTVFARVENQSGCFTIAFLELLVGTNTLSIPTQEQCDEDGEIDGFMSFALNAITTSFQDQLPANATVVYYASEEDALLENNALGSSFVNTIANAQTIYVRVTADGDCYAIGTVPLEVLVAPEIGENTAIQYCLNTFPNTIQIDSGVTVSQSYTYSWQFNGNELDTTTPFLNINEIGTYTVTATTPNGCNAARSVTVMPSNSATVTNVIVADGLANNTVTIEVSGEGDYEFALDNPFGTYTELPVFTNVTSGFHTIYIRDINGCGIVSEQIAVVGFPKYFTPNGDGTNDTWKVDGASDTLNPTAQFVIFDRYGKMLYSQRRMGAGWNGKYDGELLPSNGYWYLVTLEDGRTFRGAFSLIR